MSDFDMYRLFKTLHVLAVVLLGGSVIIEAVIGPLIGRSTRIQDLRAYARVSRIAETIIFPVGFLLIPIFGYATAGSEHIDMSTHWLVAAQALFYVSAAVVLLYLRNASLKLWRTVRDLPDGPVSAELLRQIKSPLPAIAGGITTLFFIVIVVLMVAKPAL